MVTHCISRGSSSVLLYYIPFILFISIPNFTIISTSTMKSVSSPTFTINIHINFYTRSGLSTANVDLLLYLSTLLGSILYFYYRYLY